MERGLAHETAATLPDIPREVEARGLLLPPSCRVEGPAEVCVVHQTNR